MQTQMASQHGFNGKITMFDGSMQTRGPHLWDLSPFLQPLLDKSFQGSLSFLGKRLPKGSRAQDWEEPILKGRTTLGYRLTDSN